MEYLKTIGFNSNQPIGRGFNYPYDIDFCSDGRIFVINRMGGRNASGVRIQIFTYDEEWLEEFGSEQFIIPVCIAIDEEDKSYITDEYLNEVKIFDHHGKFINKWGTEGVSNNHLKGPAGIVHGRDGYVYVVEQYANRVGKFTRDGERIASWGSEGSGEGQFNLPWGITSDENGNFYVSDWRNDRIQKFDCDGVFLANFGESGKGDGQFFRPSAVAVDSRGFMHVADWGNERVQVLDPDGVFHQMLDGEATLSKWAEEWLEVNPDEYDLRKESTLLVNDLPKHLTTAYHKASQNEPIFWGPVSVKIDSEDRLFVTEHSRHRIQVFEQSN